MPAATAYIQGVQTNDTVSDINSFMAYTRRNRYAMKSASAIPGLGASENVQLRKTGVVAALEVRISGSVVIGGTIGTTTMSYEWPYNLIKAFKLSVNGQSTLIDTRGLDLKFADIALNPRLSDRGVDQRYGNATAVSNGTLSQSHEDWGGTGAASNYMAPGLNVAATGTYPIELTYVIPVADDQLSLTGSLFGQSQATTINLEIQYATQSELFSAVGASATVSFAGVVSDVTGVVYSIPVVNGHAVVPDLSNLHGINTFMTTLTAAGDTEINLPGTGQGRTLLRLWWNAYSSATPLVMNATNYGNLGYKFGSNTVPEILPNGSKLRALNERQLNCDAGKCWGFGLHNFAESFGKRDIIDLGSTSDFRLMIGLVSSPTNGRAHITQETVYAAAVGA